LTLLRTVEIKGRVSTEMVAGNLDADPSAEQTALDGFAGRELVTSTPLGYRITPTGRERCTELVSA